MCSEPPNTPNSSHPASGGSGGINNPDAVAGGAVQGCGAHQCNITSQTVQTSPGSRNRTDIGVGERVTLTVDPAPATWSVNSGGTLSPTSEPSASVIFTAGDHAGNATITAQGSACSCSIQLTIVAPTGLSIDRMDERGFYHEQGKPSAGFMGRVHLMPDTVNFDALEYLENDVDAVGTNGCSFMTGQGHHPGGWVHVSETVISGRGSRSGVDIVKILMSPNPPFSAGTVTWSIPLSYRVRGGTPHSMGTIDQVADMDETGFVHISKGGAYVTFALSEHSSTMDESSVVVETED